MRLLLLTYGFPYGDGEEFLETEMPILAREFAEVVIVPFGHDVQSDTIRPLPPNCSARIDLTREIFSRFVATQHAGSLKFFRRCGMRHCADFLANAIKVRPICLREISDFQFYADAIAQTIVAAYGVDAFDVGYSYWATRPALALSYLKRINGRFAAVTRAHGYDVFSERSSKNHLPFHCQILKGTDALHTCCDMAREYLIRKYPRYRQKIHRSYLGVSSQDMAKQSEDGVLRIVSCSRMIGIKRVEDIAKAVGRCAGRIHWTHIGDGPLRQNVEQIVRGFPEHITCELPGHLDHADVMAHYRHGPVDVFVNFSLSEALPVSIMEAMSFGVPCIAPNVGGVSEIIDASCGWLLPNGSSPTELTALIDATDFSLLGRREACMKKQRAAFDAKVNYRDFARNISSL